MLPHAVARPLTRRPRARALPRLVEALSTPFAHILLGIVLPAVVFAGLLPGLPFPPVLRATCLLSAYVCIVCMAVDLAKAARRPAVAAFLAGAFACGAVVALPWIVLLGAPFAFALWGMLSALVGAISGEPMSLALGLMLLGFTAFIAAVPLGGGLVFALTGRAAWRRACALAPRGRAVALLVLGALIPVLPGVAAEIVLARADARLTAACADVDADHPPQVPGWLRGLGWLHSWRGLVALHRQGWTEDATPDERQRAVRAANALQAVSGDTWTFSMYAASD